MSSSASRDQALRESTARCGEAAGGPDQGAGDDSGSAQRQARGVRDTAAESGGGTGTESYRGAGLSRAAGDEVMVDWNRLAELFVTNTAPTLLALAAVFKALQ